MAIEPGSQFYHGTLTELNPGDIVQPRNALGLESNFVVPSAKQREEDKALGLPEFNSGDVAYATSTPEAARTYAHEAAEKKATRDRLPKKHVYKVEPVNPDDLSDDHYGTSYAGKSVRSPSGFRVIKRHK